MSIAMTGTDTKAVDALDAFANMNFLKVDENSTTPKYMQIAEIILSDIENGIFKIGEQIPSINETSSEFYMARDTVEKAYKVLRKKGIITSVKRRGYFVSSTGKMSAKRVLMVMNSINDQKRKIYQSFVDRMPDTNEVDLFLYNGQLDLLQKCLIKNKGHYDYFVVLPDFQCYNEDAEDILNLIPQEKMYLINSKADFAINHNAVVQNSTSGIKMAFEKLNFRIGNYNNIKLITSKDSSHIGFEAGIEEFSKEKDYHFEKAEDASTLELKKGDLFVVLNDKDLSEVVKKANANQWELGKDIGVISFDDSDLKEVLSGGITVFAPNYELIGKLASEYILNKKAGRVESSFRVVVRKSL